MDRDADDMRTKIARKRKVNDRSEEENDETAGMIARKL